MSDRQVPGTSGRHVHRIALTLACYVCQVGKVSFAHGQATAAAAGQIRYDEMARAFRMC